MTRAASALALVAVVAVVGCHRRAAVARAPIGAPCRDDAACGSAPVFYCAGDHPGGYCESACRGDGDCAAGSVCVGGGALNEGACHHRCDRAADCRAGEGYQCVAGGRDASHGYCDPPGRSEVARRLRGGAWRW